MLSGLHQEAMTEADLAVNLDPNNAWAYASQGSARTFGGWPREAIEPLNTAIRLSPIDPQRARWLHHLARAHYFLRDYEAAVSIARRACQSYPNYRRLAVCRRRCRIGPKSGAAFRRNHLPLSTETRCRFAPIFAVRITTHQGRPSRAGWQ